METQYITILITAGISLIITVIVFFLSYNMKRSRYDNERNMAMLNSMRASLEKQIYILNDKLLRSEERWKDVNHLLIKNKYIENELTFDKSQDIELNNFLKSNGITKKDLQIDKKLVFVLTPFHTEYRKDYLIVKEVCNKVGLRCIRGDESFMSGDIFPHMLRYILKANLIIANINGRNSNVLYELGIAQALDKPVILISKRPENLPIDIRSRRFLIYKNYTELKIKLKDELIKTLSR